MQSKSKRHSIFIPYFVKKNIWLFTASLIIVLICLKPLVAEDLNEISTYYIRLDLKSSSHRITDGKLTMVPEHDAFRAANFSYLPISGIITALPQEAAQAIEAKIKQNAFIQLLEQKGLKSVKIFNNDTIISYEGCVQLPIALYISPYDVGKKGFPYSAQILFSPLSFPDQWESLHRRFKIKELLNNFFLFFQ
nr:hypothetical protein [uncultured Desulfobacter sp.]